MVSISVIGTFLLLLIVVLVSFVVMRLALIQAENVKYGEIIASVIQGLAVVILNQVYIKLAVILVNNENYRTDYEWENALVKRTFPFQFINSYFALFYTAFVKGHEG